MSTIYTPDQAAQECLNSSIIQLSFSRPRKGIAEAKARLRRITGKGKTLYQLETVHNTQAFQKTIEPAALSTTIADYFTRFKAVECRGQNEQLFFLQNKKGIIALTKRLPYSTPLAEPCGDAHDKVKNYLLPEGTPLPFLIEQGVMNEKGAVLKQKYHKFRQINKFLEFIAGIEPFIRDTVARSGKPFSITDFGCGKAYLSFALYHYLHERQRLPVRIHGLDLKTEVIERSSALAERCGYTNLDFAEGNIGDHPLPAGTGMMVCLHACNTATDLALAQAVRAQVPIIFAVPCCQHELYAQLKTRKETFRTDDHLLFPFMEHGIISERFASLLTDTVRALLLQVCGYSVQIMEFIETEHTPKNILIHAVKKPQSADQAERLKATAFRQYRRLKDSFCIEPTLEERLEPVLEPFLKELLPTKEKETL